MAAKEFKNDPRRARLTAATKPVIVPKPLTQPESKVEVKPVADKKK